MLGFVVLKYVYIYLGNSVKVSDSQYTVIFAFT